MRGIPRSPVNSPHKGQWRGALMFCLICTRINGWVNNREAGDLRRHPTHCDVIVMNKISPWTNNDPVPGCRADSTFARSQWETALFCNYISHWLSASPESALGSSPSPKMLNYFTNCFADTFTKIHRTYQCKIYIIQMFQSLHIYVV